MRARLPYSIALAVAKVLAKALVELPESPDHNHGDAGLLHNPEKGPPRNGGEALRDVELDEPERLSSASLKFNGVGEQLSDV